MTRNRRQGSLVLPLVLVFIGLMFLLINLGVVDRSIWSNIIRFWPVLLILTGIDTLLRRSSAGAAFGAVVSTAVLIAAGMMLFHLFAPESWITQTQTFSHALNGASAAEVVLSCGDCSMDIYSNTSSTDLISGQVTLRRDEKLTESVRYEGSTIQFKLESEYWLPFLLSAERDAHRWAAGLNGSVPVELSLQTDGAVDLDLTDLLLTSVDLSAGDERCRITLGRESTTLFLSGERIEVFVPQDVAVRISGSASMELVVPADYIRTPDAVLSPNFEAAATRTEIVLRSGTERVDVRSL